MIRPTLILSALLAVMSTQSFATIGFEKTSGVGNPNAFRYTENNLFNASHDTRLIGTPTLCPFGGCVASTTGQYLGVTGQKQDPLIQPRSPYAYLVPDYPVDLLSFDAAELYLDDSAASLGDFRNATSITVVGVYQDYRGSFESVSATFNLDGIKDGSGGLNDFQTFFLPHSFTKIASRRSGLFELLFYGSTSAGAQTGVFALDNIDISIHVVPEPSTVVLFLLGITSLMYFRKRSMKA